MAIAFQCSCGKSYHVKPELAGKRVKCAACGKVIEVPAAQPQLEELKPLDDDLFAGIAPLQSAPLAPVPALANPLQTPVAGTPLGTGFANSSRGQTSGFVPWVWIVAGGGGLVVLVLGGIIIAGSMRGNKPNTVASSTVIKPIPKAATSPPAVGTPPASAPAKRPPSTGNWVPYRSEGGKYSISFPGNPVTRQETQTVPQGTVTRYSAAVETQRMGAFIAFYNDHPGPVANPQEHIRTIASTAASGVASAIGGRVVEERDWPVTGLATKLCIVEGDFMGRHVRQHILYAISSEKFYQIMWLGPANNIPEGEIDTFLKSFKLTAQ